MTTVTLRIIPVCGSRAIDYQICWFLSITIGATFSYWECATPLAYSARDNGCFSCKYHKKWMNNYQKLYRICFV